MGRNTSGQKQSLGWKVVRAGSDVQEGRNELIFTILDKNGALLADAVASVTISRPSTRAYDKTYPDRREQDGRYHAVIELPLYGNWDLTIDVGPQ